MASDVPQWEACKENTAPLRRGRKIGELNESLAAQLDDETRMQHQLQIMEYERLVSPTEVDKKENRDSSDEENDPLKFWVKYVQFYQDSFPSDTNYQLKLLERCFRSMSRVQKYRNDERFIKICCLFADKSKRPHDIFKYCHEQKIGAEVAIFWIAWAFVAEKEGNFPFAEKIFEKGRRKNAKPTKLLQQRLKQFQRRMSRHWSNSKSQIDELDDEDDGFNRRCREVLGHLDQEAVLRNDRSRASTFSQSRSFHRVQRPLLNATVKLPFPIFVDENTENVDPVLENSFSIPSDNPFPRGEDLNRENTLIPTRWNKYGALSNTSAYNHRTVLPTGRRQTTPAFNVFVDSECATQHENEEKERKLNEETQRLLRDERKFRERKVATITERLAHDPLRYVKNPENLIKDRIEGDNHPHQADNKSGKHSSKGRNWIDEYRPLSLTPEQSIEEARAIAKYYNVISSVHNVNNFLKKNSPIRLQLDLDREKVDSHRDIVHMSPNPLSQDPEPTPRNTSTASSTIDEVLAVGIPETKHEQTINSAWAQKEISMMFFGSPVAGLNQSEQVDDRSGDSSFLNNQSHLLENSTTIDDLDLNNSFSFRSASKFSGRMCSSPLRGSLLAGLNTSKRQPISSLIFDENKTSKSTCKNNENAINFQIFEDLPQSSENATVPCMNRRLNNERKSKQTDKEEARKKTQYGSKFFQIFEDSEENG